MFHYKGKTVLVVGGGSGIGLSTAKRYLEAGAKLCVFDKNIQNIMKYKNEKPNLPLLCYEGDVRKRNNIELVINEMNKRWNGIDILIYSAGVFPDKEVLEMKEEEWDTVMDINMKGAFLTSQLVAKSMIAQKKAGHILTVSSGSYRSARIGSAHYCSSKAALVMFTKTLSLELSKYKIKVNSLAPGLVEHPILSENYKKVFRRKIPLGRVATPDDMAKWILLITSSLNTYMTGQVIQVDGGLSAGQYDLPMSNK